MKQKLPKQQVKGSKDAARARPEMMQTNGDALAAKAAQEYLDKEEEEEIISYQMKQDKNL